MLILLIFLYSFFLLLFLEIFRKKKQIHKQKILVIGGSIGLGLSLALRLYNIHSVTIASRSIPPIINMTILKHIQFDVTKKIKISFKKFDLIFYCPGKAEPDFIRNYSRKKINELFKANLFGAINFAISYYRRKKLQKRTRLVFINSTAAIFPFTGYSLYSPFKTGLHSFLKSVEYEFSKKNIAISTVFASTMRTEAFFKENIKKPILTKQIENLGREFSADEAADLIVRKLEKKNIFFDFGSNLLFVNTNVENGKDLIIAMFLSPIVYVFKKYLQVKYFK